MIPVTDIREMQVGKMLFASETNHFEIYIVDEVLDGEIRLKKALVGGQGKPITYTYETIAEQELFVNRKWFTRKGF